MTIHAVRITEIIELGTNRVSVSFRRGGRESSVEFVRGNGHVVEAFDCTVYEVKVCRDAFNAWKVLDRYGFFEE